MHVPPIRLPQPKLLSGIALGVLIGVIGVGTVTASPAPAAPPAGATTIAPATVRSELGVEPGALLAAFRNQFRIEVNATGRNGIHDILYVRGVLVLGANQLTVTLPDDSTQAYTIDATTVVREKGRVIALSGLQSGERAMVFGVKNAEGTFTAKLIRCISEPATAPTATP